MLLPPSVSKHASLRITPFAASLLFSGMSLFAHGEQADFSIFGERIQAQSVPNVFMPFAPESSSAPRPAPSTIELALEGIGIVQLKIEENFTSFNRKVLQGTLMQHGAEIQFSEVILVESEQQRLMGSIETPHGKWLLMPNFDNDQHVLIKRHAQDIEDEHLLENMSDEHDLNNISGMAVDFIPQAAPDQDTNGETVIDIFMGFSTKALPHVQDKDAWAVMQVATVNNALKNSKIENIRVRLVGTGTTSNHQGMDWHQLNVIEDWFAADIARTSPDVVTGYMLYESGFERQAGGWAFVGGTTNINSIDSPNAFRHELGHNMGGSHCHDQAGYNFGFDNGMTKTQMCGNNINYYSNPDITDIYGLAIGNAQTANMARVWRENADKKSSNRPAIVPFEDESQAILLEKKHIKMSSSAWDYTALNVTEGTERLVITVNDGSESFKESVELFASYSKQPTTTNFDFTSMSNSANNALGINNPKTGELIIGLKARANIQDLTLTVYAYGGVSTGTEAETETETTVEPLSDLTSPLMGTLLDDTVTFEYSAGTYLWLFMGTTKGSADLYDNEAEGTTTTVTGIPQDGSTVYVTLWTYIKNEWQAKEYEFISQKDETQTDSNTETDKTDTGNTTDTDTNTDQTGTDNTTDTETDKTDTGNTTDTDANTETDKTEAGNTNNQGTGGNGQITNRAPIISIVAPQQVSAFSIFTLNAQATMDQDQDVLVYIWRQISGPDLAIKNGASNMATITVNDLQEDTLATFRLTVFDGQATATQEVTVILKASVHTTDVTESDSTTTTQSGSLGFMMLGALGLLMRRRR